MANRHEIRRFGDWAVNAAMGMVHRNNRFLEACRDGWLGGKIHHRIILLSYIGMTLVVFHSTA